MKKSAKEAVHMAKRMREIKRDKALAECKQKRKYLGTSGYLKCMKKVETAHQEDDPLAQD